MAAFRDAKGREWTVKLTRGDLRRVREQTGIELGKLLADRDQLAAVVFGDPENVWKVLWVLIEAQAAERGIDKDGLEDAWDEDAAGGALDALVVAVANFTLPRSVSAKAVATIRSGMVKVSEAMSLEAETLMRKAEEEMDAQLNELRTSSSSVSNLPQSVDSPTKV